ncbi:MAG: TlpA family protein disulfide reductase [Minisyncoccia bacterium]
MINKLCYILLAILSVELILLGLKYQQQTNKINDLKIYLDYEEKLIDMSKILSVEISDSKSNDKFLLHDKIKNGTVIIFYFSSTCSSCDEISKIWNSVYNRHKENFTIIGVTYDSPDLIYTYINRNAIEFPIFRIMKISEDIRSIFSHSPRTIILKKAYTLRIFDSLQPRTLDSFYDFIDQSLYR